MEKQPEPEKKKPVVRPAAAAESNDAPAAANKASVNKNNAVKAPLPGVITDIKVAVGDEVQAGDTVVVLEAMKMANNLTAEKGGKVTAVCVKIGESVMEDDALVVIE
jgi:biotin carboxyl carrier protein